MHLFTRLLGVGQGTSNQQGCASQSSDSELNCSDIIKASDLDGAGVRNLSFDKFHPEKSPTSVINGVLDTQTALNQQILAQLQKLEQLHCPRRKSFNVRKFKNRST